MLSHLADAAATQPADNTASLLALIGVIVAAFLTAVGGIVVAALGRKRDREVTAGLDKNPSEIELALRSYSDCRHDLEVKNAQIVALEAEVDELRSLSELLLRNATKGDHVPRTPPLEPR